MKYESELKAKQIKSCNANISHLSKQMEALSSSLREKEVAAAQTCQQVASSPEQLIKSLKLMTQIAELQCKLQQAELEKEAALQEMKTRQNLEVQLHSQLRKLCIV